jgi:elongation factor Tu
MEHNDLIKVKAKIRLLTAAEGGRTNPIKSGYRPNHVFTPPQNNNWETYIGDLQFEESDFFEPGETKIVTARFLNSRDIEKYINVGQKWLLYEVPRVIAEGEILAINDTN